VEINNVTVDKSLSKEAAVLKLVVDQPTDLNIFRLDNNHNDGNNDGDGNNDLYVVSV